MYKVEWNDVTGRGYIEEFSSLDLAISYSKGINKFVTISCQDYQIVGKFGVDSVQDGKLPDGTDYTWYKRRRPTRRRRKS